ncbi:hypothetical protein Tco_0417267, partial [Tanacetum coccineum]
SPPVLPTREPDDSLIMGNEELITIPEKESDEFIKYSVEDLIPISSESEDFSDNESECDETSLTFTTFLNPLFDPNDDFTSSDDESLSDEDVPMENFKIYSNPLFDDEEIISTKIDPHSFNAESNLIESLLNRDTLIDSSPKFDFLFEEFSGELAHIDPIPPGIEKADFYLEEEIRLVENLLYDNSSPRPPEELNLEIADTILESLSLHLLSPLRINDDSEDEDNSTFLPENELSILEPSSPRPPSEPLDVCLNFKPDTAMKNDEDFNQGEIVLSLNVEDVNSFTFVIWTFLPSFTYPEDLLASWEAPHSLDSDSLMEEIDLFLASDDSMPPGIKDDDYDLKGDIRFLEELLNNDSLPFPDEPVINNVYEFNEDECLDPGGGEIDVEVDNSFTFVTWIFLPYLTYPEVSPLLSSTKNEDTIFDPGIST